MEFSAEAGSHPAVLPSQERQQCSSAGTSSEVAYLKLQRHGELECLVTKFPEVAAWGQVSSLAGGGVTPRCHTGR
jgi:hypothetical protein